MPAPPLIIRNPNPKPIKVRVEPGCMEVNLAEGDVLEISIGEPAAGAQIEIAPDGRDGLTLRLPTTQFAIRQGRKARAA